MKQLLNICFCVISFLRRHKEENYMYERERAFFLLAGLQLLDVGWWYELGVLFLVYQLYHTPHTVFRLVIGIFFKSKCNLLLILLHFPPVSKWTLYSALVCDATLSAWGTKFYSFRVVTESWEIQPLLRVVRTEIGRKRSVLHILERQLTSTWKTRQIPWEYSFSLPTL